MTGEKDYSAMPFNDYKSYHELKRADDDNFWTMRGPWHTTEYWERLEAVYRTHFSKMPFRDSDFRRGKNFNKMACDYEFWAQWTDRRIFMEFWEAWDHDAESEQLETLELALLVLARFNPHLAVLDIFFSAARERSEGFEGEISEWEISPENAAGVLSDLHELLAPSIQATKSALVKGEHAGKTSWLPVLVIEVCRFAWLYCTGGASPPNSLNPASPFGRFVEDIFDATGVDGDPRSAMNAWLRVQRKFEEREIKLPRM